MTNAILFRNSKNPALLITQITQKFSLFTYNVIAVLRLNKTFKKYLIKYRILAIDFSLSKMFEKNITLIIISQTNIIQSLTIIFAL